MSKPIIDCKFFNCAINNGSGTCVSTLLIKCSKIPNHFNMGDGLSQFQCDCCGEMKEGTGFPMFDENFNEQPGLVKCKECLGL